MKAVLLQKPYEIRLTESEKPVPKAGQALLKVRSAGICGSDIGAFRGTNPLVSYPRIIGHEIAGEVVSIPENRKGIRTGDRVVVDPYLYCGKCYPCSIGRTNCCENLRVLGVHVDGGMAEYFAHPSDMLVKAPDNVPWELLPIAEPLTIALHAVHRTKLKAGEHAVIIGAGTIGILAALAAKAYGAAPILIDIVPERLRKAKEFGLELTVDSLKENAEEKVREYTNGRKAEVVMEVSGANAAIRSTLDYVSNAGRISLTGWPSKETSIPTDWITKKEVDIYGSRTSAGEFEEALELIASGKVPVRGLLTRTVSPDEAPAAIADIEKHPSEYLKVNVIF